MTHRARSIVAAIGLAVLAALFVGFYVSNYKKTVTHTQEHVSVWVAAKDIPAGTAGADLAKGGWLRSEQVLRDSVVPGAIADPKQLAPLISAETTYAGEQVALSRFSTEAATGVRALLQGNLRAIQIAGDSNQTLAGTLKAGDHVDLVSDMGNNEGSTTVNVDRVVLRNIRVLKVAAPAALDGKLASASATGEKIPVQLLVRDTQVQKLWFAVNNDRWTLQLRPIVKATDSREKVETKRTHLEDGLSQHELSIANGAAR
jgi:Flp pilus assembly protein CpaB